MSTDQDVLITEKEDFMALLPATSGRLIEATNNFTDLDELKECVLLK